MNAALLVWIQTIALLAAETAAIIALAAVLQGRARSGNARKAVWQICLLTVLFLTICELGGFARGMAASSRQWLATFTRADQSDGKTAIAKKSTSAIAPQIPPGVVLPGTEPVYATVLTPPRPGSMPPAESSLKVTPTPPTRGMATDRVVPGIRKSATPVTHAAPDYLAWAMGVWLLGAIFVLGRFLISQMAFGVFRLRATPVEDEALYESVRKLARDLGLHRRVRLIESARLAGPVAFGLMRPIIGLPSGFFERFRSDQREAMLAHELAHLAGYDVAWYRIADFLATVLWWHPAIWWARGQLHAATELAADEASLLIANGPTVLAECLVQLGRRLTRSQTAWRLGMAGNDFHSGLGRRVGRLVDLEGTPWRPPAPFRAGLTKGFGTLGLVAITIFSTAWVAPTALTKGENMQVIKQTWRKSLAAVILLATTTSYGQTAPATTPPGAPPGAAATPGQPPGAHANPTFAELLKDPRFQVAANSLSADVSNLGALIDPTVQALDQFPAGPVGNKSPLLPADPAIGTPGGAPALLPANSAPSPAGYPPLGGPGVAAPGGLFSRSAPQVAALFSNRENLSSALTRSGPARAAVEASLEEITLEDVSYRDLPLAEVVRNLVEISRVLDPKKQGVNIVMDRQSGANAPEMRIDPRTGLPLQWDSFDLESATVKIDPPLRHVRLIDVLEAITKSTAQPVKYSVEDYGVLVSVDWEKVTLNQGQARPAPLEARAFKLEGSTAIANLKVLRALAANNSFAPEAVGSGVTEGLRGLLHRLGVNLPDPETSLLYNPVVGVLMVRASAKDMETISALLATIGGVPYSASADTLPPTAARGGAALLKDPNDAGHTRTATVMPGLDQVNQRIGRVYVSGNVRNPGAFELLVDEPLTAADAIVKAGGFNDVAGTHDVIIVRKATVHGGAPETLHVNITDVLKGKLDKDVPLEPGDQVMVSQKTIKF